MKVVELVVSEECAGERLDRFLAARTEWSRSQLRARIDAGDVLVDGQPPAKAGQPLGAGARVHLTVPPPPPSTAVPEDLHIAVVYEDEHLIVVDKAPGMVVHPSPGHDRGTLVNGLLGRYQALAPGAAEDGRPRPGIVHRLDKDTSGLLVVARTAAARAELMRALAAREVHRRYLAIVHGPNLTDEGTFDTLHGRHPKDRKRFSSRVREGRRAVTHWRVLARSRTLALVECTLETGRTHQIRVHFADSGHPIVRDATYAGRRRAPGSEGAATARLKRQALHAWQLELSHPITGAPMRWKADPPGDLAGLIAALFGDEALL